MEKFSNYRNLKVLVTGSTGFKGSWICLWLHHLGAKVYGLSLKANKEAVLFSKLKLNNKIKQHYCDINDYKKTSKIIKNIKPDIIFHLAAQSLVSKSFDDPLTTIKTNVYGSSVILKSYHESGCKALVFCTSDKCYKNKEWIWGYKENDELGGLDPYSSSKASAEIIFESFVNSYDLNKYKTNCASVRAGNVIGGGDFNQNRLIPDIVKSYFNRKNISIKNPNSVRPWQFVLEPISGYLKLGLILLNNSKKFSLPSWNFGPDIEKIYTVEYLLKLTKKNIFRDLKYIYKNKIKNKIHESELLFLSNEKAKLELGWKPKMNINQSLSFTFDWYTEFYKSNDILNFSINQIDKYSNLK